MNILFISLIDFNNINIKGIYSDLLREFSMYGNNLFIVSPVEKRNGNKSLICKNNVTILKPRIGNIQKTNVIEKGIALLKLDFIIYREIKKNLGDFNADLILYTTPPISLNRTIKMLKKKFNAKTYLLLKDIFPQNALDLGMLKERGLKGLIYRYYKMQEKQLYMLSDYIGTMSPANTRYLVEKNNYLNKLKVEECPNSLEVVKYEPVDLNKIRSSYNLPLDKLIYVYGGNLGKPQGVDYIIDCVKANESNDDTFILIIGSGTEYKKLESEFIQSNFQNSLLLEHLGSQEYNDIVKACDVGLVFLDFRFTIPNFPSRILSYMQCSLPIIVASDRATDLGKIAVENNFGVFLHSVSSQEFVEKMNLYKNHSFYSLQGKNSRLYFECHFNVKNSYNTIMSHF